MYDPAYGRFTGVDPLADSYAAYTPYHYVLGNPLRFVDPDGRSTESIHLDEDGNFIAHYDDGDDGVYEHSNGTTESDLNSQYYLSGFADESRGGSLVTTSSTAEIRYTRSGFQINDDGTYTLHPGETPFEITETVWFGGGTGASASYSRIEIATVGDAPARMKGVLTTGNSFGIGGGLGAKFEAFAVTKGMITLEQSLTGSDLESLFSQVQFIDSKSASAALKWTNIRAYNNSKLFGEDNRIFNTHMFGAGVATAGISGYSSPVKLMKK